MKKYIIAIVLALVSIVLATLLVQSNSRISELEKELAASNVVKTAVQLEMPTSEVASATEDEQNDGSQPARCLRCPLW